MVGKIKNKTVIQSVKVREIAAAVSINKGDKLPNPAHRMYLTNLTTIQTRTSLLYLSLIMTAMIKVIID